MMVTLRQNVITSLNPPHTISSRDMKNRKGSDHCVHWNEIIPMMSIMVAGLVSPKQDLILHANFSHGGSDLPSRLSLYHSCRGTMQLIQLFLRVNAPSPANVTHPKDSI
jgi:hypothetical protein